MAKQELLLSAQLSTMTEHLAQLWKRCMDLTMNPAGEESSEQSKDQYRQEHPPQLNWHIDEVSLAHDREGMKGTTCMYRSTIIFHEEGLNALNAMD